MRDTSWQLQTPISAIVFDCDGTLSAIEGIDELALKNGVQNEVAALTEQAMSKTGINPNLYQQRLNLVDPHREQVIELGERYYLHATPDAHDVINVLHRLKKSIYLVSAGLHPAVIAFGARLGIPAENIYAVEIDFDLSGNFLGFNEKSPLICNEGKRSIVQNLKTLHPHIMHIGDGLNDCVTQDLVTRFVGYGGAFYRQNIEEICDYYIHETSLAPLLPLILTPLELEQLSLIERTLYNKGMAAIESGLVKLKR